MSLSILLTGVGTFADAASAKTICETLLSSARYVGALGLAMVSSPRMTPWDEIWDAAAAIDSLGPQDSNSDRGLSIDGGRLIGSPDGARVARVIYQATKKHKINFIIDDAAIIRGNGSGESGALAIENNIYLPSDFINHPNLSVILHEIRHTTSFRKKMAGRMIGVDYEYSNHDSGIPDYLKYFRFDELEARLSQLLSARMTYSSGELIEKTKAFSVAERKILVDLLSRLENLGSKDPLKTMNKDRSLGELHLTVFVGKRNGQGWEANSRPYRDWYFLTVTLPVPDTIAFESEHRFSPEEIAYLQEVLNSRLLELARYDAGILSP